MADVQQQKKMVLKNKTYVVPSGTPLLRATFVTGGNHWRSAETYLWESAVYI